MSDTVGLKVAVEGESEFRNSIRSINGELKMLSSDLKLVESDFKGQANSMAALQAKGVALGNMYAVQKSKVSELKTVLDAAKTAQNAYAAQIEQSRAKISTTEAALEKLKNSTGDTAAEEKKLSAELAKQKTDLANAEAGYTKTGNKVNDYQKQLNDAKIGENKLNDELKKNSLYMEEAKRSTDKCATSIDRFGKETQQAAEKSGLLQKIFAGGFLANIATQALSAVVGKVKQLATAAFDTADELEKLSSQTGLSTSKLQQMSYIGDDLGVSLEVQSGALRKLIRNMASAQAGTGDAAKAFKSLKIDVVDGNGKLIDSNIIYGKVIDALGKMTNETERDATAQKIFGKSAAELNPLIEAGSEALKDLADNAESAGAIMSEEAVGALDAAGDAFDHFKQSAKAFVGEGLVSIIGTGKTATETMTELQGSFAKNDSVQRLIDKYRSLSQEVAGSALSSGKLSEKSKELEQTKQDLIAASGGVVTAFDIENGTFDKQVTSLAGATEAEREYLTLKLKAVAIENTGVNAKRAAEKAQNELAAATARRDAEQAKNDRLKGSGKSGARIENMIESSTTRLGIYQQQVADANIAISDLGAGAMSGAEAIRQLSRAGMDSGEMAKEFGMSLEDVEAIISGTGDAMSGVAGPAGELIASLSALGEEYDTAKVAALDALNSTVGLWTAMDNTAITTAADIQTALDSQITWLNNYSENLDALAERKIPGVDTSELVQSLNDGSAESAAILAGLASATDAEVANVVASMGMVTAQKGKLSGEMGEVETGFGAALDSMKGKLSDTVGEMDMSDAAGKAAKSTMQAYVKSIKDMEGSATSAAARIARMVANVLNSTAGVIPQRHAKGTDYGENMYIAGEEGPELIVGRAGSKVWTADQTAAILAKSRNMEAKIMQTRPIPTDSSSRQTVNHTGTIRVQGVSSTGETLAVADIVMEQLRREARM